MKTFRIAERKLLHRFQSAFFLSMLLLLAAFGATAQNRWQADFRAGMNTPVKKLGNSDLKTGLGFDAAIGYRLMPHLLVNTGWGWNHFAASNSTADYEETGYTLGLQFAHPIQRSGLRYLLGVAAVYKHIEVESTEGGLTYDTGHGWGWQADAGLGIPLSKQTKLTPFVRYHSLARDMQSGTAITPVELQYLTGGIGLSWQF